MDNQEEKYKKMDEVLKNYKQDYEQFIHFAAHDLDSPLRKLSTFVARLGTKYKEVNDEDIKTYLARIENCVEEMRSVIDSLQKLSLVSSEKTTVQNCDLKKIVEKTLNNLQEEIKERKTDFQTGDLPVIQGNENQFLLLFKNIFDNSIKFSRGDQSLTVQILSAVLSKEEKLKFNLSGETVYYKIFIMDNGRGFEQEQAEDIFKPFVRLHGKSEIPGTGLGLSICKKIVENHHGFIYAEGFKNSGSRFVLILPQMQEGNVINE